MKIRTQFIISSVLSLAILMGLVSAVIFISHSVRTTVARVSVTAEIETQLYELNYLTNDYLLHRDDSLISQWNGKIADIENNLALLETENSAEEIFTDSLAAELQSYRSIFYDAVSAFGDDPSAIPSDIDSLQPYWNELRDVNQQMHRDSNQLKALLVDKETQYRLAINILIVLLITAFVIFILVNYFLNFRRITRALNILKAKTSSANSMAPGINSGGNKKDEVGELAAAFEQISPI
jgi:HAMP domain-containing protein